jgi:hypothetical protein
MGVGRLGRANEELLISFKYEDKAEKGPGENSEKDASTPAVPRFLSKKYLHGWCYDIGSKGLIDGIHPTKRKDR